MIIEIERKFTGPSFPLVQIPTTEGIMEKQIRGGVANLWLLTGNWMEQ